MDILIVVSIVVLIEIGIYRVCCFLWKESPVTGEESEEARPEALPSNKQESGAPTDHSSARQSLLGDCE